MNKKWRHVYDKKTFYAKEQFLKEDERSFYIDFSRHLNDTRGLSHESYYDTYLASRRNQYNAPHVDTHVITLNTNSGHSHGRVARNHRTKS